MTEAERKELERLKTLERQEHSDRKTGIVFTDGTVIPWDMWPPPIPTGSNAGRLMTPEEWRASCHYYNSLQD
jgi:hypothetical protein